MLPFLLRSAKYVALLSLTLFNQFSWADAPVAVEKVQDGFVSIFNGHDFQGWQGAVDSYEVVDGALRCKTGAGGNLLTNKQYANFIVRFQFRLPQGGNNGLAIRAPLVGDPAYVAMCELQVLDNTDPKYQTLDARQFHGSAYGMAAAKRGALLPTGEWNSQTVTVDGSTIRVELNGKIILDKDLSEVTETLGDRGHPGKNRTQGYFGFAGHNDPVEYRDVWIKELPVTDSAN